MSKPSLAEKNVRSHAELQVFRTLTAVLDKKVEIVINTYPKWLVNPNTGRKLELDMYLPKHKLAFEIQGKHHFTDSKQIERDLIKKQLCYDKGIRIIRLGILENNPSFFYMLFTSLNKNGYNIKMNEPDWRWGIRRNWAGKYNKIIRTRYGNDDECYILKKKTKKQIERELNKNPNRPFILKFGGVREYLDLPTKGK